MFLKFRYSCWYNSWRHLLSHLVRFSRAFPLDSFSLAAWTRSHVRCWQLSSLGKNLECRYSQDVCSCWHRVAKSVYKSTQHTLSDLSNDGLASSCLIPHPRPDPSLTFLLLPSKLPPLPLPSRSSKPPTYWRLPFPLWQWPGKVLWTWSKKSESLFSKWWLSLDF